MAGADVQYSAEEMLQKVLEFVRVELGSPNYEPVLLANHSTHLRLDRDDAIKSLMELVEDRWCNFKPNNNLRISLPVASCGPGGGKSFLIDSWLHFQPTDIEHLPEKLRHALNSSIRLSVTLNDRMGLLCYFFDVAPYHPETSISLRTLYSYAVPPALFNTPSWTMFVIFMKNHVPLHLSFLSILVAIVNDYQRRCPANIVPGQPQLILFGLDEILKVSKLRQKIILSAVAKAQDDNTDFLFLPLVTSLAQSEVDKQISTFSSRILEPIALPLLTLRSSFRFIGEISILSRHVFLQYLVIECAGVPRFLEFLKNTLQEFAQVDTVSTVSTSDIMSAWLRSCKPYIEFFTNDQKCRSDFDRLLHITLVPPFRVLAFDQLIGRDTFETLQKIGLLTSSRTPQFTGVHLRAFASHFQTHENKSLSSAACLLAAYFLDFPRLDSDSFERLIFVRECLVRCLEVDRDVSTSLPPSFQSRYMSAGRWFNQHLLSPPALSFAPLIAFPSHHLNLKWPKLASSSSAMDWSDLDVLKLSNDCVCWFKHETPLDLLIKEKLIDGRNLVTLIKFTDKCDGKSGINVLAGVIESLAEAVESVRKQFPTGAATGGSRVVVVALLLTNVADVSSKPVIATVMQDYDFPLGVLDRDALMEVYGPTLTLLHPAFHTASLPAHFLAGPVVAHQPASPLSL